MIFSGLGQSFPFVAFFRCKDARARSKIKLVNYNFKFFDAVIGLK